MPARILGMIGTQMEGVAVHLIKGTISCDWVIDFTRLHEQWGYDAVLVGYYASAAEGFGASTPARIAIATSATAACTMKEKANR